MGVLLLPSLLQQVQQVEVTLRCFLLVVSPLQVRQQQLQHPPHLRLAAEALLPACAEVEDRVEHHLDKLLLGLEQMQY